MRILVTGGHGFIGTTLLPQLLAEGHEVVAPKRGHDGFPEDLAEIDQWSNWPTDIDAVIHMAAMNPERGAATAHDDAALMRSNASATRAIASRAARDGIGHLIYLSTALVHAGGLERVTEESPLVPQNTYASSKLAGEEAVRRTLEGSATPYTILRLPPVYGPDGRGGLHALIRLAEKPWPLPFGGSAGKRSLLSVHNAADAIAHALGSPVARNETFLVTDGQPRSIEEIVRQVRHIRGQPARLLPLPTPVVAPLARALGKGAAFDRLFGSFVIDGSSFLERTGWKAPESFEDGLRRAIGASKQAHS